MHDICPIVKKSMSRKSLLGKTRTIHVRKKSMLYSTQDHDILINSSDWIDFSKDIKGHVKNNNNDIFY